MQNGQRVMRRQPSRRTLLLLGGAVLMILVGLLGMHTFSAEPAGHGTAAINHAAAPAEHSESGTTGALAVTSTGCSDLCHVSTGPGPGHQDMANACVLALLVGILLLVPPVLLYRFGPLLWSAASLWRLTSTSILPRAPSLIILSISRT